MTTTAAQDRAHAKAMLEPYRVGPEHYRFTVRRRRLFALACAFLAVGLAAPAFGPMALEQYAFCGLLAATGAVGISLFSPGRCWFEIEQRDASWVFRWVYGWWKRVREIPAEQIAMASVVEMTDDDGKCVLHHIQVAMATPPFMQRAPAPLHLYVTGWSPEVMLAICRMITPGYTPETYLLQTDLPRRGWRRRPRRSDAGVDRKGRVDDHERGTRARASYPRRGRRRCSSSSR